ncbi:MAG: 1-deoxy-D-xylulose-5-phosphate reductoisomerase [Candidatus Alcyoniella australis]|nr:1-deoxy-D-xylulose-5-phosphate reductoisomerase [Candidatus Alcyoniella australis]
MSKRLTILGSTGSIGTQALGLAAENPERFEVVGLAAGSNVELLAEQVARFAPSAVAVRGESEAEALRALIGDGTEVLCGTAGACELASRSTDLVVSAMVGAVGLEPTLAAIEAGNDVALANKEALVCAGELVLQRVEQRGVRLLPIDSEHSAILQSMLGHRREDLRRIILTASGGPFRGMQREGLESVEPEQALAHPTWKMGPKISIDSATMMNKGLEVIEAHWLFNVEPQRIEVLIHPQSIVHSLVEYVDGVCIAQLGLPDMRGPISFALSYPERIQGAVAPLHLEQLADLEFTAVDHRAFPCLGLAYRALELGGTAPAALNAANEQAVTAFLERRIGFLDIPRIIGEVLEGHEPQQLDSIERVLEADREARHSADGLIGR